MRGVVTFRDDQHTGACAVARGGQAAARANDGGMDHHLIIRKVIVRCSLLDEIEGELNKVTRGCDKVTPYLFFTAKTSKTC